MKNHLEIPVASCFQHRQSWNAKIYREKKLGMKNHFDVSDSIEIRKVNIISRSSLYMFKKCWELLACEYRWIGPKYVDGIANSVEPDRTSLIWVYTVCPDLSVRKLRNIMVLVRNPSELFTVPLFSLPTLCFSSNMLMFHSYWVK